MEKNSKYGINMKQWCREHEAVLLAAVHDGTMTPELKAVHLEKLGWLQHERLIHLIVTVMVVFAELFVVDLVLLHPQTHPGSAVIMLGFAVLLGFYFRHYFFLENTVQYWYKLTEEIWHV